MDWYNDEHKHSGIGYMTPNSVHSGKHVAIRETRRSVLEAAYGQYPARFVREVPKPAALPSAAWINPPKVQCPDDPTVQAQEVTSKVA